MNLTSPISLLTALPVVGAAVLLLLGDRRKSAVRWSALGFALLALLLTHLLWHHFNPNVVGMQYAERHAWVPGLGVEYRVGVDGLGLLMLVLSAIVTVIAIAASWKIEERVALYFALVLALEACLFGAFTALNFVHWFLYWELSLVPAFFLIRLWGGPRRAPAAMQFLVYTMTGSVAMLLAFVALYLGTGSFDFLELAQRSRNGALMPGVAAQMGALHLAPHAVSLHTVAMLVFCGVFLGFAVKVPLIPFHTWLPATYAEAPTGATVLLTGAMSKMGVYGFLRVLLPIFVPQMREVLTPLLWLAVASVVLSAFSALAQKDLKRIFAYSSINHLGYCMLALFAAITFTGADSGQVTQKYAAMSGAILQMFNHGLTAATIFWCIALIEQRSGGLRGIEEFGGLRKVAPVLTGLMGIAIFSSLGLPGLNGFIGEFLIFKGSFPLTTWATSLSVIGLMVTAIFLLGVLQKVFSGPTPGKWSAFPDLTGREQVALAPAIALMFVMGLYPQVALGVLHTTVVQLVQQIGF